MRTLLLVVSLGWCGVSQSLCAQEESRRYDVDLPRQSVAASLNQLAKQTGEQFLFPYDLARQRLANPMAGQYTLMQAVTKLLHCTGFTGGFVDGVLTVVSAESVSAQQLAVACPDDQFQRQGEGDMKFKNNILTSVIAFLVSGTVQHGMAEELDQEQQRVSRGLEEIIVTASKRETSLQDTGLSVSAISGGQMKKMGITSYDQIMATIPGVTVIESGAGFSPTVFRGIATSSGGDPINASTSTYVNDFPLGLKNQDIKLVDMAQIEVLKGP
jgi:iron complex outermembrane recepter protein